MTRLPSRSTLPRNLAVIMDGNGRWAKTRGLSRMEGHRHGVEATRRLVETVAQAGIPWLTLFCFSSENWSRPSDEVSGLFELMRRGAPRRSTRAVTQPRAGKSYRQAHRNSR